MKLYATTTSERASKGQGGNNYLDIRINAGKEQAEVFRMLLNWTPSINDKYGAYIPVVEGDIVFLRSLRAEINKAEALYIATGKTKGEKKKGEVKTCDNCGSSKGYNNSSGSFQCDNCGHDEDE